MNCIHSCRSLASAAVLLLALGRASMALDASQFKARGYVNDFADVLDPSSEAQLTKYCAQVEQATGAQIAVVTIASLQGTPIEDFTNDLFRQWGVGKKGKDEGLMLLLAIRDRKSRIEVGYGLEPILPDGFVGSVLREMGPSLKTQQYASALTAGTAEIGDQIASAKGVALDRTLPRRAPPSAEQDNGGWPWPLIIFGVVILFAILGRGRRGRRGGGGGGGLLSWILLSNILSNSRYRGQGGWGGGGFGGYDGGGGGGFGGGDSGGGGFGGFGGGDSGGGGASGSW